MISCVCPRENCTDRKRQNIELDMKATMNSVVKLVTNSALTFICMISILKKIWERTDTFHLCFSAQNNITRIL